MKKIYIINALCQKNPFSMAAFTGTLILILCITLLYLYNIFKWADYPDFGFGFRDATGMKVVGVVTDNGRKPGIQVGDNIFEVNGKTFTTVREVRSAVNWELGKENTYLLERKGQQFQFTVTHSEGTQGVI